MMACQGQAICLPGELGAWTIRKSLLYTLDNFPHVAATGDMELQAQGPRRATIDHFSAALQCCVPSRWPRNAEKMGQTFRFSSPRWGKWRKGWENRTHNEGTL